MILVRNSEAMQFEPLHNPIEATALAAQISSSEAIASQRSNQTDHTQPKEPDTALCIAGACLFARLSENRVALLAPACAACSRGR